MPTLDNHQSSSYTKVVYIGDSGTGKTGSLVSLLAAGFSFRILDLDNGLDPFVYYAKEANLDLSKVEYHTIRDKYKSGKTGPRIDGTPTAFVKSMDVLTEWSAIDDPNCVCVVDSGSALGRAAFEWAKGMNPTAKDPRQWYFAAQQAMESVVSMLTGEDFRMNVILISHVNYKEVTEGVHKGYPNMIGSALGPTISKYFNTLILAETSGSRTNTKRKIKTLPTGIIDLKVPTPKVEAELPLETGMATLFASLRGTTKAN